MIRFFLRIGGFIATHLWWPHWSNFRWRKAIRKNVGIKSEDRIENIYSIEPLLQKLYFNFKWTSDDASQLWDSIMPPPQIYTDYMKGLVEDDCDGFHSLVMHVLKMNGVECYLLAVEAIGGGHCVLLMRYTKLWWVIDYTHLYNGFSSPEEAIRDYEEIYAKKYKTKKVFYSGLLDYDYDKGKFINVYVKNLKKE